MRYGLQDGAVTVASQFALSQYEYLLSSEFNLQGYNTHIVGSVTLFFATFVNNRSRPVRFDRHWIDKQERCTTFVLWTTLCFGLNQRQKL